MFETIQSYIGQYGPIAIFAAMMFGIAGLPIPDETILVFSGYLISRGKMSLPYTIAAGILGSFCGITLSYVLGRTLGYGVLHKYGRWIRVSDATIERIHGWFQRWGAWTLTIGYYIAGVRHFTAFVAGASHLEYPRFALFAYPGGIVWVLTFLSIGYYFGENWQLILKTAERNVHLGVAIAIVLAAAAWLIQSKLNRKKPGKENKP